MGQIKGNTQKLSGRKIFLALRGQESGLVRSLTRGSGKIAVSIKRTRKGEKKQQREDEAANSVKQKETA